MLYLIVCDRLHLLHDLVSLFSQLFLVHLLLSFNSLMIL